MATPSYVPTAESIIQVVADSSKDAGPISIIVTMKIKAQNVARALELWRDAFADTDATEPAGNIKNTIYRRNAGDVGESDEVVEFIAVQE